MKRPIKWTLTDVAERFEEAVFTLRRLPRVRKHGYFNVYPPVIRTTMELLQAEKTPLQLGPPSSAAISRMEETLSWIFWIDDETERRIIWLRAARVKWRPICKRLGCSRTTAHYKYRVALFKIVTRLNCKEERAEHDNRKKH